MDDQLLILVRGLERILIVAVGGMCVYLGYRLFDRFQQRQGELELKGENVSFKLRDVAPGIYFALFGSLLLVISVLTQIEIAGTKVAPSMKYLREPTFSEKAEIIHQQVLNGTLTEEEACKKLREIIRTAE